ncbi:MAG: C-GCAxxG-C-C family protein [Gammaproteobacteria bacterium]|nr:C-GCAxxG-C-C family protein [Gammaproteobacteria bacterium]
MNKKDIETIKKKVIHDFSNGLYCAESVVIAITKSQGIESDLLPKAATAFCSGMARTCGTCGALTGAIMGVSAVMGRSERGESVEKLYAATQKLVNTFEDEFGAKHCHELLGCDLGTPEGQDHFRNNHLHESHCLKYAARAAEIAVTLIAGEDSEGD